VDGEVARLKLMETRFGHYLDITTDNLVHLAVFVGIAYGQYNETESVLYIWALWALLGGFLLCVLAVYHCILCEDEATLKQSPRVLRLMEMVTNRDFAYLLAFLALVDRLHWFVIGASLGTYAFAAGLWFLSSREKQKRTMLEQPQ
jgi:1L-myo-inositol 1-phosphate cytidylyltransferase / CDP-L-myo-inositol myo-inositolphosphotransferase